MNWSKAAIILSNVPIVVTCLYAAVNYKGLGKELKVFCAFLFFSGLVQVSSLGMWFFKVNNLPILHTYVGLGFVALVWFYATVLSGFINQKILWCVAGIFLAYNLINTLFFQDIFTFSSNALTVESILMVVLSLFTFIFLVNDQIKENKHQNLKSLNWINSGLFIYFSSNLLLFYFGKVIMHAFPIEVSQYTWILHSVFTTVMYLCFFVGLWMRPKK